MFIFLMKKDFITLKKYSECDLKIHTNQVDSPITNWSLEGEISRVKANPRAADHPLWVIAEDFSSLLTHNGQWWSSRLKKGWRPEPVPSALKYNNSNITQNRFGLFSFSRRKKKKRRNKPIDFFPPVSWGKGLCPGNLPGILPHHEQPNKISQGYSTEGALYSDLCHPTAPKSEEPEMRIYLQV